MKTQLCEEDALIIARNAVAGQPFEDALYLVKVDEQAERLVWIVASATIGSGLEILVDDAFREIIIMKHIGVR